MAGHPYEPTMAVSGIDHTIKIFSPDAHAQRNARKGVGVEASESRGFSGLSLSRRSRAYAADNEDEDTPPDTNSDSDDEVGLRGLKSRRRMHDAYQITSKNDMDRKGGREDYFISVS
jgi:nuclear receptor interaction protein